MSSRVIIFRVRCLAWYIQGLAYEAGKRGCPEEAKDPVKAAKCFKIAANLVCNPMIAWYSCQDITTSHRMTMTMASTKTNSILFLRDSTMRKRVKYSTPLTSKSLRQSMASRCAKKKQLPNSMSDKYHHRKALRKKLVHYCFKSRYASFPSVQTACNYATWTRERFSSGSKSLQRSIHRLERRSRKR